MNTGPNSPESFEKGFLASAWQRFDGYRKMGEAAMAQLSSRQFFENLSPESNSIAIIIQHMAGNMRSRWTDFLTSDGEKAWRDRDREFDLQTESRDALMDRWNSGWNCLLGTLRQLDAADLMKEIHIRTEALKAYDAIIRQMMHYSYHIGQIVLLAKWLKGADWEPLSVPRDQKWGIQQPDGDVIWPETPCLCWFGNSGCFQWDEKVMLTSYTALGIG